MTTSFQVSDLGRINETQFTTVPCHEWEGYCVPAGYGRRKVGDRLFYVHRLAWEEAHGPIPEGLQVDHLCNNPPCYEVRHLRVVTMWENVMALHSNTFIRRNVEKTTCPRGHPYDWFLADGRRRCRQCHTATAHRYRERQRQLKQSGRA